MNSFYFFRKRLVCVLMLFPAIIFSQSTYTSIYSIFQSRCASCHSGITPAGNLNLGGTASQVYTAIVNAIPNNSIASAKGDKLIDRGRPHSSFLLRKIQNGLDTDNGLTSGEGVPCPQTGPPLANKDIEKIRQWIYKAAPQTTNVVDTNTINMYYGGQGYDDTCSHPLPTVSGSYQLHIGKIFVKPSGEMEYFLKFDLRLPDTIEANRVELFMGQYSHHFILYKFTPGSAALFPDSMRIQNPQTGQGSSTGYNTLISAWQTPGSYTLPSGTAYQWELGTVIDYDHHLFNPNSTKVMAADIYINVYTQPKHTAQSIMYSTLVQYSGNLYIPNTNTNIGFSQSDFNPNATNYINLWLLSTHTHKYGIDYDIYLRNPNNTLGTQIFEGFYNTAYTYNQGYYDWEHPPVERFSPLLQINPREGLIQQAVFKNYGPAPVTFGLTTNDEMMLYFMQYTIGAPLGVEEHSAAEIGLSAFPNPFSDKIQIVYELKKISVVNVEVYDVLGRKIVSLASNEMQPAGKHQYDLAAIENNSGIYFVKVSIDSIVYAQRIIETK